MNNDNNYLRHCVAVKETAHYKSLNCFVPVHLAFLLKMHQRYRDCNFSQRSVIIMPLPKLPRFLLIVDGHLSRDLKICKSMNDIALHHSRRM